MSFLFFRSLTLKARAIDRSRSQTKYVDWIYQLASINSLVVGFTANPQFFKFMLVVYTALFSLVIFGTGDYQKVADAVVEAVGKE